MSATMVTTVKKALLWFMVSVLGFIAGALLSWAVMIAGASLSAAGIGALHYSYEIVTVLSFFAAVVVIVVALRRHRRQAARKSVLMVSVACGYIAFTIATAVLLALFAAGMSGFEP